MSYFLQLRHWELFLMLALPTALVLLFRIPLKPLVVASIGLFLMIVLFAWMISVAVWSNQRLPPERQRSPALFVAGLIVPIVYALMYIVLYLPQLEAGGPPARPPVWLFPMHMLSMAGIFYGLWYTARQYKSLQESVDADFLIFSSTFFLLFIFPLGIWIIQPSVNALYYRLEKAALFDDES